MSKVGAEGGRVSTTRFKGTPKPKVCPSALRYEACKVNGPSPKANSSAVVNTSGPIAAPAGQSRTNVVWLPLISK